jgi:pimeloyl-ACP methyl ester carboxylesterase
MATVTSTNPTTIELCYETFGDPSNETILLVMGYTAQMIVWGDEMIDDLVARGFHVVIFDNRDCGLSHKTEGPPPDVMGLLARSAAGETVQPHEVPYTLSDMAADAIGLLDHLDIETAHVVGASMGGMIVQTLAIEHPERLRSVTSIMSTTGNQSVGQATPEAMGALLLPPPEGRDAIIAQGVATGRVIAGPLFDEGRALERTVATLDRSFHPVGAAFQLAAIGASGDRTERLASVDLPFLVIHGAQDQLIQVSGGEATAEAVPKADLLVLDAMGHDMPVPLLPQINSAIEGIARRVVLDY